MQLNKKESLIKVARHHWNIKLAFGDARAYVIGRYGSISVGSRPVRGPGQLLRYSGGAARIIPLVNHSDFSEVRFVRSSRLIFESIDGRSGVL